MGLLIKLKNGDTTLKSLKYGNDRPGGGDSGQPYIKDSIDQPTTPTNEDSILRGGLKAPTSAAEDVARLTKYFFDFKNPNGLLFVGKQNLLSRISPKTETSFGPAYGGFSKNINIQNDNFSILGNQISGDTSFKPDNGALNAGIYTPLSTLAQAGVNFSGTHLNKQGLDPTGKIANLSINKYQDVAYQNNLEENNNVTGIVDLSLIEKERNLNKRIINQNQKISNYQNTLNTNPTRKDFFTTKSSISTFQAIGTLVTPFRTLTSTANTKLNSFSDLTTGGELGVKAALYLEEKRTEILNKWDKYIDVLAEKRKTRTENAQDRAIDSSIKLSSQISQEENKVRYGNRLLQLWNSSGLNKENKFSLISDVLYSYSGGPNSALGIGSTEIKFATKNDGKTPLRTNEFKYGENTTILPIPLYNKDILFNLGDPGKKGDTSNYILGKPDETGNVSALDKVTYSKMYGSETPKDGEIDTEYRDLIPFYIGTQYNDSLTAKKWYMHFRAFIDDFGDSYKAKWKSQNYMGRAESFFKYSSFDRDISIGFTIVAQSRKEQKIMYEKLNYLASTLAPFYLPNGYMAGNISYITVGDYISDQPGIIESLTFDIPEDSSWETARDQDGNLDTTGEVYRLPFMIKVKMKFQPIHTFRPQKQYLNDIGTNKTKYISQTFYSPTPTPNPTNSNLINNSTNPTPSISENDLIGGNEITNLDSNGSAFNILF